MGITDILAIVGAVGGLAGGVAAVVTLRERLAKGRAPKPMSAAERKAEQRRREIAAIVDDEVTKS